MYAPVLAAGLVFLFSVALAAIALFGYDDRIVNVSPLLKAFVSGLLTGLGLLAMLPSALDSLPEEWPSENIMLVFLSAPFGMFFIHHIILDHSHATGHQHLLPVDGQAAASGSGTACALPPVHIHSPGAACAFGCDGPRKICFNAPPTVCVVVGTVPDVTPKVSLQSHAAGGLMVLLRALPYVLHATIDGAMLGTAETWAMLASLMVCVSICAIQDVGTILINLSASGTSRNAKLVTNLLFAAGFPLGAAVGVAFAASAASAGDGGAAVIAVAHLRAFAAGLFVYMAIFELAPPHAHGRTASAGYMIAFLAGVMLIYVSEAVEAVLYDTEAVEAAMTLAPESALNATAALVATVVNRTGGHGMPVGP